MRNPFRRRSVAAASSFDPGANLKLQYAVQFLNNHVTFFGPPPGGNNEDWKSSQVQQMDHVPADIQVALNKACVAAALYVEQVFIEGM